MQFSESWLRSFVNPALDTQALSHQLTMAGLEVEEVTPVAPPFEKIVVAHVLETAKHPDADRLNVCKVDVGTGELLQIVCGAPNVKPGIKVPCALVGAVLPPAEAGGAPFQIKVGKLRGVESYGMLCSARELKISEDSQGLLILADDAQVGQSIREHLDLDDHVFLIKLTPNKADCLSVHGVAREVSALTGSPITLPNMDAAPVSMQEVLPVKVSAPDLCGRFAGRVMRGVNAKATTPSWMVQRLERAGQRSISALVDISNYVMLELGRPTHVFDLDKISGGIEVRWGKKGESLKLLNGNTVELDEQVGVIADSKQVESLAGIMGGDSTAVSLETQNIYLEAAFWLPSAIQGRSRRFNFSTDAAHRFERGVDYESIPEHIERITNLILQICGGQAGPVDDQIINLPKREPVRMRVSRAAKIIGVAIPAEEIAQIFTRLGLHYTQEPDAFVVTPPSHRFDIEIEEDLVEEVVRIYGFENIPTRPPVAESAMLRTNEARRNQHSVRHTLAARGYQETVNFGFVEKAWEEDFNGNTQAVQLLNPLASQLAVMRSNLFGSLIANVRYNINRKASRVRAFEVGRVFAHDTQVVDGGLTIAGYAQPLMAGGIAYGPSAPEQWGMSTQAVDFFDVKADVEALLAPRVAQFVKAEHPALHPGRSARIELDGLVIGWMGELHPKWQQKYELPQAPILFELQAEVLYQVGMPTYTEISKYPQVSRDLAFVVHQSVQVGEMVNAVWSHAKTRSDIGNILQAIVLFDEFRPKNATASMAVDEKSLAFRLTLQDTDSTLQDETVERFVEEVRALLNQQFGARLRA